MADPFEVRMKFSHILLHLNASVNSQAKAANYAIKCKDMDEDLHSCILEQLERNNMNNRANIMHFIEQLCDAAQREGHLEYARMIQRDIMRIVDAAAPPDGSGAANVKVVRRVLAGLQKRSVIAAETVEELEEVLRERDVASQQDFGKENKSRDTPQKTYSPSGGRRVDKRQIEQRIEEDRERHKRQRESYWAVPAEGDKEFEKLWDDASDIGEDDFIAAEEDAHERRVAAYELE